MMDDHKLDDLLMSARTRYRVPPEPSREAIWQGIEAEAFAPARRTSRWASEWRMGWKLAAASLVIGVLAGRMSARTPVSNMASAPGAESSVSALAGDNRPYQQTTEEVLGRSAVLLTALRANDIQPGDADQMSAQATRLLGRIRLLIDSPASADPKMLNLLLDLETTLAQVARIQPSRGTKDVNLINEAVVQRDIVPRIQSVVVDLSAGGY
jgi:hypothetical protein